MKRLAETNRTDPGHFWRMKMRRTIGIVLLVPLFFAGALGAQTQKPLSNDDVVRMVKTGFAEQTITEAIRANPSSFDTSVGALEGLKTAGVSEKIISAMLSAKQAKPPANDPPGLPDDVGVYLKHNEQLIEVNPEIVAWRSGGVGKSLLSLGLTKGHVNGVIKRAHSELRVATPLEFLIRCPEGTAITEYQLLRLWDKSDRREFRTLTGGVIHPSSGSEANMLPFHFDKVAPRTYRVKLDHLPKGEYGFLPPAVYLTSATVLTQQAGMMRTGATALAGKIYTFSVIE